MFKEQNLQQISFGVPAVVFHNLAKRAAPLNIRPVEYARRLFEAAYAVRVAGERGQETEDGALDHQVRQVFLLADCEPEFIAEALKLPIERVKRMLEGWRQAARELVAPPIEAETVEPKASVPPPMPSGDRASKPHLTADEISVIRNLWREGKPVPVIAATVDRTAKAIENFASRNRDICPKRRGGDA